MQGEVSLKEMLAARDSRAALQTALLAKHGGILVSYTLNIPGPVKRSPLADRSFREGSRQIERAFNRLGCLVQDRASAEGATGLFNIWALRADASVFKTEMRHLEETHPLGRLFDIDVIAQNGSKLSRGEGGGRKCLLCENNAHACTRSRVHPSSELAEKVRQIMDGYFQDKDARFIASCAVRALLYELATTPKPGLVDRANNGSHSDMGFLTFIDSALALQPYFEQMARAGGGSRNGHPQELLKKIRPLGMEAEQDMYGATSETNTHKGAIFSLGIVCAAAGWLGLPLADYGALLALAGQIAEPSLHDSFEGKAEKDLTKGERACLLYGVRGARAEAASGFLSVKNTGLPVLQKALARGDTIEEAGVRVLLSLISAADDTNLLARAGGPEAAKAIRREVAAFLAADPSAADTLSFAEALDAKFIKNNISAGGCADLLAITYFLHLSNKDGENGLRKRSNKTTEMKK